jgi:hypothetical protein
MEWLVYIESLVHLLPDAHCHPRLYESHMSIILETARQDRACIAFCDQIILEALRARAHDCVQGVGVGVGGDGVSEVSGRVLCDRANASVVDIVAGGRVV